MAHCAMPRTNSSLHASSRRISWSDRGSVENAGTLFAHLMLMKRRRAADSHTDSVATSYRSCSFCLLLLTHSVVLGDTFNPTAVEPADLPALHSSPVFRPGVPVSLGLLASFPDDLQISGYCGEMLRIFGQRYQTYLNCLVPAARPVRVCVNCFSSYGSLKEIYTNISSDQMGPGNVSCSDSLLHSDRLMLVYQLYSNLKDLWGQSGCDNCITDGFQSLTNYTEYYMAVLNQTITCFQKYQQGNYTELCKDCKSIYGDLNQVYSRIEKNKTLCIDIEDAMNGTRKLWSKNFNCSLPREETVPVIAVSSFMLFLPIIFYLSSFLHSEQKKRKLIHPKRAKSYASLMNIQDKRS